jgi:hypothetical protein
MLATPLRTEGVEALAAPMLCVSPGASAYPTPWAAWGKIRIRTHQAKPVGEDTTERCPMREGSGNFFETWMI